jgi:periplasmic divalent cation tolerance protein
MSNALVCLCTCPDEAVAGRLARALVEDRVAACVNVLPGLRSIYRWQDEIQEEPEVLLIIKTTVDAFPALEAAVRARHPYTVPELVALPVALGHQEYLAWLCGAVR